MIEYYCDRCHKLLLGEGNSIHEFVSPNLKDTPKFRIHVHFLKQFNEGKADLCESCVLDLLNEWVEKNG